MNPISSLVADIENALSDDAGDRRHALLRRITGLFIDQVPDLNEEHISVFDEVILCLAIEIELAARMELSERLADLPRGPRRTIQNLAHDDEIDVARPVIERSPCISDEDLTRIAQERSIEFLTSLSKRVSLSTAVTDILLERGSADIVERVTKNSRQALSDVGLRLLAQKATEDQRLYRLVRGRPDLALRHVGAILEAAKQRAKSEMADLPDQLDILERALEVGAASLFVDPEVLDLKDNESAAQKATIVWPVWPTDLRRIAGQIERGDIAEALAGMAYLAEISRESVEAAFAAEQFDSILFMARAIGMDWPIFMVLLKAREGGELSSDTYQRAHSSFHALSKSTAERVMRFIASRLGNVANGGSGQTRSNVK